MFRNIIKQSRQLRTLSTYKTSTGLVGLAVDPDGRNTLLKISAQVMEASKKLPANAAYRTVVEQWSTFLTKSATNFTDIKAIEDEIGLGQIEEVIEMAKDELKLVDFYFENRGWELVDDAKKNADEIVRELSDSIYFTAPQDAPKAAPA